jgi:membrane fusion protein (multidrug efflux system)
MNKVLLGALLASAVAAAAGGGYWYGAGKRIPPGAEKAADAQRTGQAPSGPRGPAQPAAVSVEVTRVGAVQLPETITAVGSLRSDESVTLRPEVAGRITDILFKEGRPVAKGDTLVRLDPSINQAEVRQARANLTLAQGKYERSVDLAGRNFISVRRRTKPGTTWRSPRPRLRWLKRSCARQNSRRPSPASSACGWSRLGTMSGKAQIW